MRKFIIALSVVTVVGLGASPSWAEEVASPTEPAAVVPAPIEITVNIPARQLTVTDHGQIVATYPVAIGQLAYRSVTMDDAIHKIEWNPTWYPPPSPWAVGAKITPPGPKNPLGPVKMPLGQSDVRIHGTNKDGSVGTAASHGCFRMHNQDAVTLAWYLQTHLTDQSDPSLLANYEHNRGRTFVVPLNQAVPVHVVYETAQLHDGTLHLYPDVYGHTKNWYTPVSDTLQAHGVDPAKVDPGWQHELRARLKHGDVKVPVQELLQPMNAFVPTEEPAMLPSHTHSHAHATLEEPHG